MRLAVTGIDHQPFKIRLIDQDFEQFLPQAPVAPANTTPIVMDAPPGFPWRPGKWGSGFSRTASETPRRLWAALLRHVFLPCG